MSSHRSDAIRLSDILRSASRLEEILHAGYAAFEGSWQSQSAAVRELEVIGEAAGHISTATRHRYPGVRWTQMRGFSSFAKHEYWRIDPQLVWNAIVEMPALRLKLSRVLPPEE